MRICGLTIDAYIEKIREFHGHVAPGMLCGGFMVDLAFHYLPEGRLYDSISETRACLPDAIQILTPCTVGNGWLRIEDTGRFALIIYDKETGDGVRVALDPERLAAWPEFQIWAMKLKPKKEQDKDRLLAEIRQAGSSIYKVERVRVDRSRLLVKGKIFVCDSCGESFRDKAPGVCAACRGKVPFQRIVDDGHGIEAVPVDEAAGKTVLHDMTRIKAGISKGPAYLKGEHITPTDVETLKSMGKHHIYVSENAAPGDDRVHENDAALAFASRMAGDGIGYKPEPREGKIDFKAEADGVFLVDVDRLRRFNRAPGVMCATRRHFSPVSGGQVVAGTRAIPLYLPMSDYHVALGVLEDGPIFQLAPYRLTRVGIVVTGTEVAEGRIPDAFMPIIEEQARQLGCSIAGRRICPDDRQSIYRSVCDLIEEGAEVLVVTGGMSVDPDDVTRAALQDADLVDEVYGSPVLPGAMTLVGRIGNTRVIGVPAGALYFERTAFELLFPRLLADLSVTRLDMAELADGGFLDPPRRKI